LHEYLHHRRPFFLHLAPFCGLPQFHLDVFPDRTPASTSSLRYSPTGVVDDVLDDSSDVSVLLSEVERPELGRVLPVVSVGLEDPSGFTLVPDNSLQSLNNVKRWI
jgi:hypothetical protein